jgi:hypothetical protein
MKWKNLTNIKWSEIDWPKVEHNIFNLQKKIYNETKIGNTEKARKYQKVLVKSIEARILAVRRITQDNQGKATAGIDGLKNIQANDRMKLIRKLVFDGSASKVRRV